MPATHPSLPPARRLAATIALVLLVGACKPAPAPDTAAKADEAPAAALPTTPALGSFGFDTAGMDRNAVAGDNFFQYANGEWVRNTEIPADRSSYNSFTVLVEKAATRTRAIIDEAAKDANATGEAAQIRDFYNSYMDEAAIEAAGLAPLQPRLDAIAAIADPAALARALGETVRADVDMHQHHQLLHRPTCSACGSRRTWTSRTRTSPT